MSADLSKAGCVNSVQSNTDPLVSLARRGDADALGKLLERHRGYLKVLAERILDGKLRARLDASDIVQKTCLSVHANIAKFQGDTPAQFLAWLRQIHEANVKNVLRDQLAERRAVGREGPVSAEELDSIVADALQSSPSQRVLRDERAVLLAAALEQLPDDQREAVRLRFFEGLPLKEIGKRTARSDAAAGALIMRGMATLRKLVPED